MVYEYHNRKGTKFYLHKMNGRDLYFFKTKKKGGACDLPAGMSVGETENGLPVVRRD